MTEQRMPHWRVKAVRDHDSVPDLLEHEDRYTPPPSTPAPWPDHSDDPAYTDSQVDALLDEIRGDH